MNWRIAAGLICMISCSLGFAQAEEQNGEPADLKTYYTQEKLYWDNFMLENCTHDSSSKKCQTAAGMQKTYVYLLTDLMRDKTAKRFGTQDTARTVYEVPAAPAPNEETAGLTDPQPAVENIP